jgi:hypothetical protein
MTQLPLATLQSNSKIHPEAKMNKKQLTQTITIFVATLIAGILMVVLPYTLDLGQAEMVDSLQSTLPLIGAAIISAGLTFFLVEMVRVDRERVN